MAFEYKKIVELERAVEEYLGALKARGLKCKTEKADVRKALGRVSAAAVYARLSSPHYEASAMDGIAIKASDSFGATQTSPKKISCENYTVVDTGDPIPEGKDAVIMVEELVFNDDRSVNIYAAAHPWQHIRQIGEDICEGDMILPSYTEISPSAIGALIAGGVMEIELIKKPLVGIIPTGDEIVPPGQKPESGELLEFNSSIFSAMLEEWGAEARVYPIVKDKAELIREAVKKAAEECDAVILNAGASAGRDDYSAATIAGLGEVFFHGIAIKPGKPAILGAIGNKPVIGVPGYPVSGIVVINELLRPVIEELTHKKHEEKYVEATLSRSLVSGLKYKEFVRVYLADVENRLIATALPRGAGVVSSFMKADGMLEVARDREGIQAGERVRVRLLRDDKTAEKALLIMGSHDPLVDELRDLARRHEPPIFINSAHVGSMGGIMALKRGEAHMGFIHLLDEESGEYNKSYLRKHFPNGGVRLIHCVGRQQGLIVGKGNPLQINGFEDLGREGIRFVNRQRGSGTRILCDYMLGQKGISGDSVYGYTREELTHSSVAIQVASGSADVGLGICQAARLYGLDFIPVCTEDYELIVKESLFYDPSIISILNIIRSVEFAERLEKMGGYILGRRGETIEYI